VRTAILKPFHSLPAITPFLAGMSRAASHAWPLRSVPGLDDIFAASKKVKFNG
jgi:hypothetical protein